MGRINTTLIIAVVAALVVAVVVIVLNKANAVVKGELSKKENEIRELTGKLAERDADLIRKVSEVHTAEALRESEKKQHELALLEVKSSHAKSLAELKAGQEKAIEAAKTALALSSAIKTQFNVTITKPKRTSHVRTLPSICCRYCRRNSRVLKLASRLINLSE